MASQIVNVVEVYPLEFYDWREMFFRCMSSTSVHLEVTVRRFTRHIYRRSEGRDLFLSQNLVDHAPDRAMYIHSVTLGSSAAEDRQELYHGILDVRPRHIGQDFSHWSRVARTFSDFAAENYLLGSRPDGFALFGDQALGTIHIMGTLGRFQDNFANVDLNVIDGAISCNLCGKEFELDDNAHSTIGFHCEHVFHKECIYEYVWMSQVHNDRGTDYNVQCPQCDDNMIVCAFDD